jgi:hypothetical protein
MTARISVKVSKCLVGRHQDTMPPRNPNDDDAEDEDENEDAEGDEDLEPAVVREPDE